MNLDKKDNLKTIYLLITSNFVLVLWLLFVNHKFSSIQIPKPNITKDGQYASPFEVYQQRPIDVENASVIFNSVHGALKQKDANVFPVGVTFIPAYIPPNTRFFHSTGSPEIPDSFEWIAMDYEFSYNFAHVSRAGGPGKHGPGGHGPGPGKGPRPGGPGGPGGPRGKGPGDGPGDSEKGDKPEGPGEKSEGPNNKGHSSLPWGNTSFLYTFRTTKPLDKLIFLDGASAAKTSPEMDQQMILSRQKNTSEHVNERVSSEKICAWGKPFGLQGIVRLEIGYEVILCDFHRDVELISNSTLNLMTNTLSFPDEEKNPSSEASKGRSALLDKVGAMKGFEHLQAGGLVNKGDPRIKLDFSNMITPVNRTYINPNPYKRNMSYISIELREELIHDIEKVYDKGVYPFDKTDWQVVTNFIVYKFGPMLNQLNYTLNQFRESSGTSSTNSTNSIQEVGDNLVRLTFNYMRRYNYNSDDANHAFNASILDYVYHTYPLQNSDVLIYSSIFKVQFEVQTMVFKLFELGKEIANEIYVKESKEFEALTTKITAIRGELHTLLNTLQWSLFTDCARKCGFDETCYVPTWGPSPLGWGASEDYFDFDGETYSIPKELKCISYKDLLDKSAW